MQLEDSNDNQGVDTEWSIAIKTDKSNDGPQMNRHILS